MHVWSFPSATVHDGSATLRVPAARTRGSILTLAAPWDGSHGCATTVVLHYGGTRAGDHVAFRDARGPPRATGCWHGTTTASTTLTVAVRRVRVSGVQGRTTGTLAWTPRAEARDGALRRAPGGVLGTQDPDLCAAGV